MPFDGITYSTDHDQKRLVSQLNRVKELMSDKRWRTLPQIKGSVGGSEAGISARLRDLRKEDNGAYLVNRRRVGEPSSGLWEYQVVESIQPFKFDNFGQGAFL